MKKFLTVLFTVLLALGWEWLNTQPFGYLAIAFLTKSLV